jgi:hypothetical protein
MRRRVSMIAVFAGMVLCLAAGPARSETITAWDGKKPGKPRMMPLSKTATIKITDDGAVINMKGSMWDGAGLIWEPWGTADTGIDGKKYKFVVVTIKGDGKPDTDRFEMGLLDNGNGWSKNVPLKKYLEKGKVPETSTVVKIPLADLNGPGLKTGVYWGIKFHFHSENEKDTTLLLEKIEFSTE